MIGKDCTSAERARLSTGGGGRGGGEVGSPFVGWASPPSAGYPARGDWVMGVGEGRGSSVGAFPLRWMGGGGISGMDAEEAGLGTPIRWGEGGCRGTGMSP